MAAQLSGVVPSTWTISAGRQPRRQSLEWGADYGNDTTVAIRHRTPLREFRFPPAGIEVLLQAGEVAPFVVARVTLVIAPRSLALALISAFERSETHHVQMINLRLSETRRVQLSLQPIQPSLPVHPSLQRRARAQRSCLKNLALKNTRRARSLSITVFP
jgi:hypothetical protein